MSRHKQKPRPLTRSGFSTIRRLLTLTSLRFASAMMLIHKPGVLLKKYGFSCVRTMTTMEDFRNNARDNRGDQILVARSG